MIPIYLNDLIGDLLWELKTLKNLMCPTCFEGKWDHLPEIEIILARCTSNRDSTQWRDGNPIISNNRNHARTSVRFGNLRIIVRNKPVVIPDLDSGNHAFLLKVNCDVILTGIQQLSYPHVLFVRCHVHTIDQFIEIFP